MLGKLGVRDERREPCGGRFSSFGVWNAGAAAERKDRVRPRRYLSLISRRSTETIFSLALESEGGNAAGSVKYAAKQVAWLVSSFLSQKSLKHYQHLRHFRLGGKARQFWVAAAVAVGAGAVPVVPSA